MPIQLRSQPGTRLLMVTSLTHRGGKLKFDDLQVIVLHSWVHHGVSHLRHKARSATMRSSGDYPAQAQRHYVPLRQYCDSKLALVMAVQSLQRRFDRYTQMSNEEHTGSSVNTFRMSTYKHVTSALF
jgi:hypothetical protein